MDYTANIENHFDTRSNITRIVKKNSAGEVLVHTLYAYNIMSSLPAVTDAHYNTVEYLYDLP